MPTFKPFVIHPSGEHVGVKPANGTDFQLDELYKLLDCHTIEVVDMGEDQIAVIDEEGKLNGSLFNREATRYWHERLAQQTDIENFNDYLCGRVLICHTSQLE